ncbi:MAG: pyridoxal-phosphate dependent enzyme, partial [bacterium]
EIPEIIPQSTIAEGIAIPQPPRGKQIMEILRKTEGKVLQVQEEEILKGMKALSSQGILAEPTSAVAVAAFLKTPEERGKRVLIPITGSGLKTPEHYRKILF